MIHRRLVRRFAHRARSDARGASSIEVMLALIVMSTAMLGAAAASASSWRVAGGARVDTGAAAALHFQAEELIAAGHDQVTSGTRVLAGHAIRWTVAGTDPKVVLVTTETRYRGETKADTVRIILRPDPS